MQTKTPPQRCLPALFLSLLVVGSAQGQSGSLHTGHATPGVYGLEASLQPPRGLSYENFTMFYTADSEKDRFGHDSGVSGRVKHLSNHTALTWGGPWLILGATYSARLRVSLASNAPNPRALSAGNDSGGLGDTYLEPLALHWQGEKGTVALRYGFWWNTGDFTPGDATNVGKGFRSNQVSLGLTRYITEDRLWHYSLLARYSIHTKVEDLDVRPGEDVIADWNIGRRVNERLSLGLAGYGVFQTTRDRGADASTDSGYYGTGAVGLICRYSLPDWQGGAHVRLYQEINAYNHTEGQLLVFGVNFRR